MGSHPYRVGRSRQVDPRARSRSRYRSLTSVAAAIGLLVASSGVGAIAAPTATAASQPPSTTVVGTAPIVPRGAHAKGDVPDSTPVHLVVTLKPRDRAAMRAAVTAVATPGSPLYRSYLSSEEFGSLFGASDAQVAAVRSGLRRIGLDPGPVSPNHLSIPVETNASTAERALGTQLRAYGTADGHHAFANTTAPKLPTDVASGVRGIIGLDTFPAARSSAQASAGDATSSASPAATESTPSVCAAATDAAATGAALPADYLAAYSADELTSSGSTGRGQTVAILSLQQMNTSDVNVYRQCFGATGTVQSIAIDGGAPLGDGTVETTLDVEAMLGLAPGASVSLYHAPNTAAGWYDDMAAIIGANSAHFVSVSWGLCEPAGIGAPFPAGDGYLLDAEFDLLTQAALQGQTVFAASGDTGSAGCYDPDDPYPYTAPAVSDPASQPYATAVGGTTLVSATAPPDETVWNDSYGASGGGISNYWFQPGFQQHVTAGYDARGDICGNPGGYCRTVPDVAASADPDDNGFVAYVGGDWVSAGGTSLAAPMWAALGADMNSSCPATNGFGMLNFTLYALPSNDFNDVTSGNNDFEGLDDGAYPATPGYDLATGLGTPVVSRMVSTLCGHSASLDPETSFVLAAYADFTGSLPLEDPADPIDTWATRLANGTPRSVLLNTLANSDAWVAHIVQEFYVNTLGRAPDAGGLAYWESIIETHAMSVAQVAAQFYSSLEFYRRDGSNPRTWVADLYDKLLERTASPSELDYWVAQVQAPGRGRAWVAYSFYQSEEPRSDRVANLYQALLHRAPDPGGQAYWAGRIRTDGDIALAVNLAASVEYYGLAGVRFPGP